MMNPIFLRRLGALVVVGAILGFAAYHLGRPTSPNVAGRSPLDGKEKVLVSADAVIKQLSRISPELIEYRFGFASETCLIRVSGKEGSYVLDLSHLDSDNRQTLKIVKVGSEFVSFDLPHEPVMTSIIRANLVTAASGDQLDSRGRDALGFLLPALDGKTQIPAGGNE